MIKENELYQLIDIVITNKTTKEQELKLFNEVLRMGYKIVHYIINEKFRNLPIIVEDTYSYVYLVFIDTVRWCQIHKCNAKHFINLFFYKLKYCITNLCVMYSKNGHHALNFSDTSDISNDLCYEPTIIQNCQLWQDVQSAITNVQKRILKYKLDGYKVYEIAKKLKCSTYFVRQQMMLIQTNPVICELFNKPH